VKRPASRGLGRKLIERTGQLPYLKSRLEFLPQGVQCRIWVSIASATYDGMPYFNPSSRRAFATPSPYVAKNDWKTLRRVLVIEDDPLDALRIEEALGDAGYLVLGPIYTEDAVGAALHELAFDAVIINSEISSIDLGDVLERLEANARPVMLIGENGSDSRRQLRISRPLVPGKIVNGLANLLRGAGVEAAQKRGCD
jgi:CheY-like chemotaxis protein